MGVVLVLAIFLFAASVLKGSRPESPATWSQGRITATYVGTHLKQLDKAHSSLVISYDLENGTNADYRLADGLGALVLARLKSDGSLSQEQPLRLSYPVFLPPGQHARLAIEITQPFVWPAEEGPSSFDKFRAFVKSRLENVEEFVVFDEANHSEVPLPSAWGDLSDVPSHEVGAN